MLEAVDIRQCWERVREWIEEVIEKVGPQDWRPEDIYAACATGHATLFCDAGDREGLVVISMNHNPFTGEKFMFVWLAYSRGNASQAIETYENQLMEIARKEGCAYVEHESTRRGFERRPGWMMGNTTFRRSPWEA